MEIFHKLENMNNDSYRRRKKQRYFLTYNEIRMNEMKGVKFSVTIQKKTALINSFGRF